MPKVVTVALLLLVAVTNAQSPRNAVQEAADKIGAGRLATISYTASGTNHALGQGVNPDERVGPSFNVKSLVVAIDYSAPARRQDMVRTSGEKTPRGGGGVIVGEQRQVQVVNGNLAWNVAGGKPTRAGGAAERSLAIWLTPHGFLKKALTSSPAIEVQSRNGRQVTLVSFAIDGAKVRGTINDQNLVEQIDTWRPHVQFGDMLVEELFSDYKDFGGTQFPTRISRQEGGYLTFDLTVGDVRPNAAVDVTVPDTVRSAPLAPPAPARVEPAKVADGIWRIGGINAQNSVIEFRDFLVVYEAPGDDARSTAVIAEIKKLVPGKPIRYIVDSHHHQDHSGGLRGYAADGATIVTHAAHRAFYTRIFAMPFTLSPDSLARSGRTAKFEYVSGRHLITDGTRTMQLYDLPKNDHAVGSLAAYLPAEKILFESDLYSPGYAAGDPDLGYPHPWNVQLYDNILRLKLDVAQVVPTHGPVMPIADLQKRVGR